MVDRRTERFTSDSALTPPNARLTLCAVSSASGDRPSPCPLPRGARVGVRGFCSRPPPRQRADDALGQPVDREQEQRAVEDEPVVEELRQELRQDGEDDAARHWSGNAPEPAEEEGQEEEDRSLQRETVRRNVTVEKREESARHSREG